MRMPATAVTRRTYPMQSNSGDPVNFPQPSMVAGVWGRFTNNNVLFVTPLRPKRTIFGISYWGVFPIFFGCSGFAMSH